MGLAFDSYVLAATTATLVDEPAARDHADVVEFRMDLAEDPFVELDDYDGELPLLVTNRASWAGGESGADEEARLASVERAARYDAVAAADVELDAIQTRRGVRTADRLRESDASVVASVHDHEATPPSSELRRLLYEAAGVGDVGKVAVTANSPRDVLTLLDATYAATGWGHTVAAVLLGDLGRHANAVAPVYGSKLGYAPARADATTEADLASFARLREQLRGR